MSSASRSSTDDIEIVSIGDMPSAMTKSARTYPEIVGKVTPWIMVVVVREVRIA